LARRPLPTWEISKERPRSISGVKLDGTKLVKYAYMDESGISAMERTAVVAGIIVDADKQWILVEKYLSDLAALVVPEDQRDGFIFHATDLFHKHSAIDPRISHQVLKAILAIPSKFHLTVVFGFIRKPPSPPLPRDAKNFQRLRRKQASDEAETHHSIAFSECAIGVESFMRRDVSENEIATLVAENNTHTQKAIKAAYNVMKGQSTADPVEQATLDFLNKMHPGYLPFKKIKDTVHLVQKHEASLLQVADACALILRYSLEQRSDAEPFIRMLSSNQPEKVTMNGHFLEPDIAGGFNVLTFSRPPRNWTNTAKGALFQAWQSLMKAKRRFVTLKRSPNPSE